MNKSQSFSAHVSTGSVPRGVVGFGFSDAWILGVLSSRQHVCWALANGGTLEDRPRYNKDVCFDTFPFPPTSEAQRAAIAAIGEELDAHRKRVLDRDSALTLTKLYNVIDKLKAGTDCADLDVEDRHVFDAGLLLVLRELHDRLDAAVADAYGWPTDITDDDILARLVALNKERAAEETRGIVHWLRPNYQIPRFGSATDRPKLDLVGGGAAVEKEAAAKPLFPADDLAQTAAVLATLAGSAAPLDPTVLARAFKQGRKCELKVRSVLSALVRMGYVVTTDAGRTFLLRRAA